MTDYKDRASDYVNRKLTRVKQTVGEIVDGDEDFEVLDLTQKTWVQKAITDLSKAPVGQQLAVGGATGWCAGYLFSKVGRAAAAAVGGSLLVLQIAHHKGYVTVNWGKVERGWKKAQRQIEQNTNSRVPQIMEQMQQFLIQNAFLAGGFSAGFFLGLAT